MSLSAIASCSLLAPAGDHFAGEAEGAPDVRAPEPAPACPPGEKRCDGACVSLSAPATGCAGAACAPCAFPHGEALCVGGACALGPCENGYANCNRRPDDGCEVDTRSSSRYCGSCLLSCGGVTPVCEAGECVPLCHAVKLTSRRASLRFGRGIDVGSGDFTVELWFRRHADFDPANADAIFVTNGDYYTEALSIKTAAPRTACDVIGASVPSGPPVAGPALLDGAWHHVACVRERGILRLFVDGTERASRPSDEALRTVSPARIGSYYVSDAVPMYLGPMRWSSVARYRGAFSPRSHYHVDKATLAQYLVTRGFDGERVVDEGGGGNDGVPESAVVAADDEAPCR